MYELRPSSEAALEDGAATDCVGEDSEDGIVKDVVSPAWPGGPDLRDLWELIASQEALNTSQDQACLQGALRNPAESWNTTGVLLILW